MTFRPATAAAGARGGPGWNVVRGPELSLGGLRAYK
jgi:hypothetical protein